MVIKNISDASPVANASTVRSAIKSRCWLKVKRPSPCSGSATARHEVWGGRKSIDLPLVGLDYNSYWKMGEWAIMPFYKLIVTSSRANFGRQESVPLFFLSRIVAGSEIVHTEKRSRNWWSSFGPEGCKLISPRHWGGGIWKNYQQRNWSWLRCKRLHLGGEICWKLYLTASWAREKCSQFQLLSRIGDQLWLSDKWIGVFLF